MCEYINGAIIQEDFNMEEYIFDKSNGANAPADKANGGA